MLLSLRTFITVPPTETPGTLTHIVRDVPRARSTIQARIQDVTDGVHLLAGVSSEPLLAGAGKCTITKVQTHSFIFTRLTVTWGHAVTVLNISRVNNILDHADLLATNFKLKILD